MAQTLQEALDSAFTLYLNELLDSRTHQAYLGALHIALAIPDVCGALESDDGVSSGQRYMEWTDRHLVKGDATMTSADWYKVRCSVLHQGSSLPADQKGKTRSQYASVSFVSPRDSETSAHRFVIAKAEGKNITLNIASLCDEVCAAVRDWFDWLHTQAAATQRSNVMKRLRTVISPRWKMYGDLPNPRIAWSSSGSTPIFTMDFP